MVAHLVYPLACRLAKAHDQRERVLCSTACLGIDDRGCVSLYEEAFSPLRGKPPVSAFFAPEVHRTSPDSSSNEDPLSQLSGAARPALKSSNSNNKASPKAKAPKSGGGKARGTKKKQPQPHQHRRTTAAAFAAAEAADRDPRLLATEPRPRANESSSCSTGSSSSSSVDNIEVAVALPHQHSHSTALAPGHGHGHADSVDLLDATSELMARTSSMEPPASVWAFGVTCLELSLGHTPSRSDVNNLRRLLSDPSAATQHPSSPFPSSSKSSTSSPHQKVSSQAAFLPPYANGAGASKASPTQSQSTASLFSEHYRDLLTSCLQEKPEDRPSASVLISHRFFSEYPSDPASLRRFVATGGNSNKGTSSSSPASSLSTGVGGYSPLTSSSYATLPNGIMSRTISSSSSSHASSSSPPMSSSSSSSRRSAANSRSPPMSPRAKPLTKHSRTNSNGLHTVHTSLQQNGLSIIGGGSSSGADYFPSPSRSQPTSPRFARNGRRGGGKTHFRHHGPTATKHNGGGGAGGNAPAGGVVSPASSPLLRASSEKTLSLSRAKNRSTAPNPTASHASSSHQRRQAALHNERPTSPRSANARTHAHMGTGTAGINAHSNSSNSSSSSSRSAPSPRNGNARPSSAGNARKGDKSGGGNKTSSTKSTLFDSPTWMAWIQAPIKGKKKARTPATDLPQTTLCASKSEPTPLVDTTYRFSHKSKSPQRDASSSPNPMSQSYPNSTTMRSSSGSKRPASASSARTSISSSSSSTASSSSSSSRGSDYSRTHLRLSNARVSSLKRHDTSYRYSYSKSKQQSDADAAASHDADVNDAFACGDSDDSDSYTQLRRRHSSADLPSPRPHQAASPPPRPSLGSSEYPAASTALRRRSKKKLSVTYAGSSSSGTSSRQHERVDGFATPQPRKSQSGRQTPRTPLSSQRSRYTKALLDRASNAGTTIGGGGGGGTARGRSLALGQRNDPHVTPAKFSHEKQRHATEHDSPTTVSSPATLRRQPKHPSTVSGHHAASAAAVASASPSVISAHPCAPESGPRDGMVVVGRFLVDEEPASPEPSKVEARHRNSSSSCQNVVRPQGTEKQQLSTLTRQQHAAATVAATQTRTTSRFQVEEEVMDAADVAELAAAHAAAAAAAAAASEDGSSGSSPMKASTPPRHPRVDRLRGDGSPQKRRHSSMTVGRFTIDEEDDVDDDEENGSSGSGVTQGSQQRTSPTVTMAAAATAESHTSPSHTPATAVAASNSDERKRTGALANARNKTPPGTMPRNSSNRSRASSRHGSPAKSRPLDTEDWASRLTHPKELQPLEDSYMISDSGRAIPVDSTREELEDDGCSSGASATTSVPQNGTTASTSEAGSVAPRNARREASRAAASPRARAPGVESSPRLPLASFNQQGAAVPRSGSTGSLLEALTEANNKNTSARAPETTAATAVGSPISSPVLPERSSTPFGDEPPAPVLTKLSSMPPLEPWGSSGSPTIVGGGAFSSPAMSASTGGGVGGGIGSRRNSRVGILEAPSILERLGVDVANWSNADVSLWLESLGGDYKQYTKRFDSGGVDGDILLQVDETMLRELNVEMHLHRVKIMRSVNKLKHLCGLPHEKCSLCSRHSLASLGSGGGSTIGMGVGMLANAASASTGSRSGVHGPLGVGVVNEAASQPPPAFDLTGGTAAVISPQMSPATGSLSSPQSGPLTALSQLSSHSTAGTVSHGGYGVQAMRSNPSSLGSGQSSPIVAPAQNTFHPMSEGLSMSQVRAHPLHGGAQALSSQHQQRPQGAHADDTSRRVELSALTRMPAADAGNAPPKTAPTLLTADDGTGKAFDPLLSPTVVFDSTSSSASSTSTTFPAETS